MGNVLPIGSEPGVKHILAACEIDEHKLNY
jgi:hypothetical protein